MLNEHNIGFVGQLTPEQMVAVAKNGFLTVFNNRPDDEQTGQPKSVEIEQAARNAGLNYIYQPVVSGQITEFDLETFARHYHEAQKPILMFCRSGARSNMMYQMAVQKGLL